MTNWICDKFFLEYYTYIIHVMDFIEKKSYVIQSILIPSEDQFEILV